MNKIKRKVLSYKLVIIFLITILAGYTGYNVSASALSDDIMDRVAEKIANIILGNFESEIAEDTAEAGEEVFGFTTHSDMITPDIRLTGTDGYVNFTVTEGSSGYGIRNNSGTMQYKNSGGTWSALGGTTPGDEGWVADTDNEFMYPATSILGDFYPIVLGETSTSSPANSTTELYVGGGGGLVVEGELDVAGAVELDGGAVTINNSGADVDFTVEGNTDTALIVADASADKVGISISEPTYTLDVGGDIGMDDKLYHNDDADSYLSWDAADNFTLWVGGEEFIDIVEDDAQDILEFGDGGDIDFDFNDMAHIIGSTGFFGIGDDTTPDTMLEVVDATGPQVTIAHTDATDYFTIDVDANGDVDIIASGGDIDFGSSNLLTTGNIGGANGTFSGALYVDTDTIYVDATNNAVGVGTTTPNAGGASFAVNDELEVYDDTSPYDTLVELKDSGTDVDSGIINVYENNTITALISGATGEDSYIDTDGFYYDGSSDNIGLSSSTPMYRLSVVDTASQLALAYDSAGVALFDVNASDDLTITASGGDINFDNENITGSGEWLLTGNVVTGGATTTITATTSAGDLLLTAAQICDGGNEIELEAGIDAGAFTVTLPTADLLTADCFSTNGSKTFWIDNNSGNNVTITAGTGGDLLEGDGLNVVIATTNQAKIEIQMLDGGSSYRAAVSEWQDGD